MLKRLLILIFITVITSSLIFAEFGYDDQGVINDPQINERANACYEGGTLEGMCDSQLLWDAGWYLIRFEFGLLSREEIPDWLTWILPQEIVPQPLAEDNSAPPPPFYCGFINTNGDFYFLYTGTANEEGNLWSYGDDSTCTGPPDYIFELGAIVEAASESEAEIICENMFELGRIFPARISNHPELWVCKKTLF